MAKTVKYPEYMEGMVPGVDFPTKVEWLRMTLDNFRREDLEIGESYEEFLELNYGAYYESRDR